MIKVSMNVKSREKVICKSREKVIFVLVNTKEIYLSNYKVSLSYIISLSNIFSDTWKIDNLYRNVVVEKLTR